MTLLDTHVLIRALEQKDVEALRCLEQTAQGPIHPPTDMPVGGPHLGPARARRQNGTGARKEPGSEASNLPERCPPVGRPGS